MELDDTLAFPPRPHSAETAVHGSWGRRAEVQRKEAMAWYLRMCAMGSLAGKVSPSIPEVAGLDRGNDGKLCPRAACQHPPWQYRKAELC